MSAATVKLRSDLIFSEQPGADGVAFVLKDPISRRFFRFRETEHFIARQLDGVTSPETIRERVEERYGAALPMEGLQQFINRLQRLGLATAEEAQTIAQAKVPKRIAGDIFYLRFKAFDPDRLFAWLVGRVQFFFTPQFVALSATLGMCGLAITIANRTEILREWGTLLQVKSLLIAWLINLVVITFHEFAHGITCKHFGGSVRDLGFMLIYFQPAFYCNMSDAWLFPEKRKRLWVTAAGAYFEIFLWAMATIIWRLTEPGTTINFIAVVVSATSAIKTLFNINPLIKLDGYYFLSDWIEIPNLRQKAFAYLGSRFRGLWGASSSYLAETTPRDRRIFVIYALLAGFYTYSLLGRVLLWFAHLLINRYQGIGFLMFVTGLSILFRHSLRKWTLPITARVQPILRKRMVIPKSIRIAVTLGGIASVLFFCRMDLRISGSFTVLPLHNADVRAEVEGTIQEVRVHEGELIEKGTVLARLSDRDFRAELLKTQAELEAKQAQLKLLKAGARAEEIELARTQVAKADARVTFGRANLEMDRTLAAEKLISEREFSVTKEMLEVREKEVQEAGQHLKLLLAGTRPEEIEALEADVSRLKAQENYLKEQMRFLTVLSPITGIMTTRKLEERVGEHVKKGDLIADVHDLNTVSVEIAISEKDIAEVQIGQKVTLKARAHPRVTFQGAVTEIAPIARKENDWQPDRTVLVTTRLDNANKLLKPEMTGNAKISAGERRLLDLITRRVIRYIRVEFWSWW